MQLKFKAQISVTLLFLFLLLQNCSSLSKVEELHNSGQDDKALEMLEPYISDSDPSVRLEAIQLAGKIGGKKAGAMIQTRLKDSSRKVQMAAIKNIGKLKYEPASDDLVSLSPHVRGEMLEETATAIRKIGQPAITRLLKKFRYSTSDRKHYKRMIIQVGPLVTDPMIQNLKGKSYFENRDTFEILVALKSSRVAVLMLPAIEDMEVADHVINGLIQLGRVAVDPTISYLKDAIKKKKSAVIRERLVKVLGELRDSRAVSILEELSNDENDRVRNEVDRALNVIRGY